MSTLLTLLLAVPLVAFGQTFTASVGFSSTQGQNGWRYLDGNGTPMTYVAANLYWKGAEAYNLVWRTGHHPGSGSDSIRRWSAPSGGSILITGKAYDENPNCGNGVSVLIKKNVAILWQESIANKDVAGKNFSLTSGVVAGDAIDFIVQSIGGDNSCDSTFLDPTITLTAAPAPSPTPIPPPPTPPPTTSTCGTMSCGTGIVTFDVTVARPVASPPLTASTPCVLGEVRFSGDGNTMFVCVAPSAPIKWRKFVLSAF